LCSTKVDFSTLNPCPVYGVHYNIPLGNYRIIYAEADDLLIVPGIEIGHRREIYRKAGLGITSQNMLEFIKDKIDPRS
jgi:hypothetical protein